MTTQDFFNSSNSKKDKKIKFFPSYVGSKAFWLPKLESFRGSKIAELFCGSSVISANLASKAVLNDFDFQIYNILSNFKDIPELETFTSDDYFAHRGDKDWWKYAFYFQKMSFSGVFRYSKNGYNVPIKPNISEIHILPDLLLAKKRMEGLNPTILNKSYIDVPFDLYKDYIVVLDPPYQDSQASYNTAFNYEEYWDFIEDIKNKVPALIIFDRETNLKKHFSIEEFQYRKMTVNGKYQGDMEAMVIHYGT
jgi:site-specific DNA-adenine methylase